MNFGDCKRPFEHTVVATICLLHKLKLIGFARNYFASVTCSSKKIERNEICKHCKALEAALDTKFRKVCVKEEDLAKDFKYYHFHKYSELKVPCDPIFYFDHIERYLFKASFN